jgi:hypothetical protein
MTALRLLLTGLGLLLLAFLVVVDLLVDSTVPGPSVLSLRGWTVLALTLVGAGLVVLAGLVSALTAPRRTPAPEPAVDHYA